jgi:hypothetical protein
MYKRWNVRTLSQYITVVMTTKWGNIH